MADYLSSTDNFMWSLGFDPVLRSTIVTLTVLERTVDWSVIVDRFDQISNVVPRFRQRVRRSTPLRRPRWELDPDFNLDHHLRKLTAPQPGTAQELLDLAQLGAMDDFCRDRPLWQATFVDGLADGTTALLCRFDHALTDGIGAVQIASVLYDNNSHTESFGRDGAPIPCAVPRSHRVESVLRHPLDTAATGLAAALSVYRAARPVSGPRSPVMRGRTSNRHVDTMEVSRSGLQRAANAAEGSLNDAFIAAVAGGLRRYHECHDASVGELIMSMPISIRTRMDSPAGNRATLMRVAVPVGLADPRERIAAIHQRTRTARGEKSLGYTDLIAAGLNTLPRSYIGSELRHVDFVASDVPGFPEPLRLGGVAVKKQYAFSPTLGASVNATLLSYIDTCYIGINVDTGAIPDDHAFYACLAGGCEETMALGR
ncbi:DUF1298 domain-containing protein [Mycolicibacterium peregrinum]|uniref:wax ester/triacylglycerol synthase domain-containing protein n=1 Tax=Mycolicibacterium peregrinum TaxID=43304 RepID=UPI0006D85A0D|nr:wax ester/triacylglycerol synthase domain-containing protein [Mycolicibacterium peregrinum]MCV7200869.1 DUF1298 domain-containing protein [Mycolicibacterium peregrinum]ORW51003.1 diacylglycerol O-acyltransferase [Mycolicibacterium peregrinum]